MAYPKWFPYPKCWLKSLELMLWTGINLLIGYSLFWVVSILFSFPLMLVLGIFKGTKPDVLTIIFAVLMTIIYGFIFIIFPVFIFAHIHQFLWGEPNPKFPQWLPAKRNLLEGFLQYLFVIVAVILVAIILFPFFIDNDPFNRNLRLRHLTPIANGLTITIIAYFYHLKYWFKRKSDLKAGES